MDTRRYEWRDGDGAHELVMVWVPGTRGTPYGFGNGPDRALVEVGGFYIATTPVTQALYQHVMGANPSVRREPTCPVENVSWNDITAPGGFLDRIDGTIRPALAGDDAPLRFRLPSEAEWEYAARGGPHWQDGFRFSGSHDPDEVAWYGPRWGRGHQLLVRLFGWRRAWRLAHTFGLHRTRPTRTHPVAGKAPNQLGLYDMSGNVWEWCEDACAGGTERRLRGGCHHNWDLHCTVWWRYGIAPDAHDGCIGFRVVLSPPARGAILRASPEASR